MNNGTMYPIWLLPPSSGSVRSAKLETYLFQAVQDAKVDGVSACSCILTQTASTGVCCDHSHVIAAFRAAFMTKYAALSAILSFGEFSNRKHRRFKNGCLMNAKHKSVFCNIRYGAQRLVFKRPRINVTEVHFFESTPGPPIWLTW